MRLFRAKFFAGVVAILLVLGLGYIYREEVGFVWRGISARIQPCQKPITYSIVGLDSRFGLTKTELLDTINRAEEIWESSITKQLFEYSETGDLKISLVYGYQQKATDAMREIGIVINDDRATYDALNSRYDSLLLSYDKEKARIEGLTAILNAERSAYEQEVKSRNNRGRFSKEEYEALEQKRIDLNNQIVAINQASNSLNELVDTISSAATVLNRLIVTLNLEVDAYNEVNSSTGETFNQGEYVRNAAGTAINIFQFNNENRLLRVLAHEFGHALGIEHLDNPEAIMYYLNEGVNEKLTTDDLIALKKTCKIE